MDNYSYYLNSNATRLYKKYTMSELEASSNFSAYCWHFVIYSSEISSSFSGRKFPLLRKVPFLIYSKETKESLHKEITTVMGMYDVMPTLGLFLIYSRFLIHYSATFSSI